MLAQAAAHLSPHARAWRTGRPRETLSREVSGLGVACFCSWRATLARCLLLASCGFGVGSGWGCQADSGARPHQRYWTMPPRPSGGSGGGASSEGGSDTAGTTAIDNGGTGDPVGGSGEGSGSGSMAVSGAGGTAVEMPSFDAGTDPDRNSVVAGQLCDRLATIQCAGEAACCSNPGRDFAACKDVSVNACSADLLFDQIAMQASAGFSAERAHSVFEHLEQLAAQCDPGVAAFGESQEGLRSIFLGTVPSGGDCRPNNILSKPQGGAALASCMVSATEACLPTAVSWMCKQRQGAGGACFTDINCIAGFYCPNPDLDLGGANCLQRKMDGTSCAAANECQSLFCSKGTCVPASKEVAYCPE
jgi:hypothetical protein